MARPEGQEWRVLDPVTATPLPFPGPGHGDDSPEIDRGQLRGLLLEALAPGTIRWGCSVTGVTSLGDGTWRLHLDDGTAEDADLVVGADGAWSRIRPALSDSEPGYTGVTFIETGFDDCDTRHPDFARMVGNGTLLAKAGSKILFAQRNSKGHIRVYFAFRAPQNWQGPADVEIGDTEAVRAHLLELFDGWHESLLYAVRHHDGGFINRPLFVLPAPHTWEHLPGITLLGDAAHLMPPVGLGANLAMLDGTDLAHALITESSIDDAVRAYESLMLPRSAKAAQGSAETLADLIPPTDS
ncbi:monooxygenase [Streptomyces alanosinicus]|uniref:Monooxygenase n=1 Tax=Streptomyces alanosinicus TaxID=68171 RepID=A0A918YQL0_9ACTN|nr:monooxygenase [Streptomyces alanosinicus]